MELYGCARVSSKEVVIDPYTEETTPLVGKTVSFDHSPGTVTPHTWPTQQDVFDWIDSRADPSDWSLAIFRAKVN